MIVWNIEWNPPERAIFKPHGLRQYTPDRDIRVLLHLAEKAGKGDIIEIGCNEGHVTANLALAFPDRFVLGIDPGIAHPEQATEIPTEVGRYVAGMGNATVCTMSSEEAYFGGASVVFIDGDHRYEAVHIDTLKALEAVSNFNRWVIVWHDYDAEGVETWRGVGRVVRETAERRNQRVFTVSQTSLAYMTSDNLPWT